MMIDSLPRREREIFELLCSAGEATAAEIRAAMQEPPSYSAVRTLLARLERLGKYRAGKGCLYIKRLADVDAGELEAMAADAWARTRDITDGC